MNLFLLLISRIRYGNVGLDMRYFMPLVIVAVPWMALGLEYLIAAARWLFQCRGEPSPGALRGLAGGLIAIVIACSFLDGPLPASACMRKHAALGRWIQNRAGPEPAIVGNLDVLDTFYSNGRVVGILMPGDCLLAPMPVALPSERLMQSSSGTKSTLRTIVSRSLNSELPAAADTAASMRRNSRPGRTS